MSRVAGQASTGVDSAPDGVEVEGRRLVEVVDPVGVEQVRVAAPGVHRRPRGIVLRIVVLRQGDASAAFEVAPVLRVQRRRVVFPVGEHAYGRASGRERECQYVSISLGAVLLTKT